MLSSAASRPVAGGAGGEIFVAVPGVGRSTGNYHGLGTEMPQPILPAMPGTRTGPTHRNDSLPLQRFLYGDQSLLLRRARLPYNNSPHDRAPKPGKALLCGTL